MTVRWIAMYDLMSNPETKRIIETGDEALLMDALFVAGFDTKRGVEYQDVYCRSMLNHNELCYGRYAGFERTDKEWLDSENCTFENRIHSYAGKDKAFTEELIAMSATYNYTGELIKQLEEAFGKSTVYEDPNEPDAIFDMLRVSENNKKKREEKVA